MPTHVEDHRAPAKANKVEASFKSNERARLFEFSQCEARLRSLINTWDTIISAAERRRIVRNIEVDIESLVRQGKMRSDETLVPIRVIDNNIQKEKPSLINFVKQSPRLCVMHDQADPAKDMTYLEQDFTRINRYNGWDKPFQKVIDGAQLHGWDHIEIEYNSANPALITLSHTGHENLIFDTSVYNIHDCEEIMRRYKMTVHKFQSFAMRHKFNQSIVDKLVKKRHETDENAKSRNDVIIYKRWFKWEGVCYVCWLLDPSEQDLADEWLLKPRELVLGDYIVSKQMDLFGNIVIETERNPETMFPIDTYFYTETEDPKVTDHKGRYFYDKEKQIVQSALWSVYVNGCIRASNVYGSPVGGDPSSRLAKLDLTLEHGCFYNREVKFWAPEYPSSDILRAANALDVKTSEEMGDIAAAVVNREDSRKTAKEISFAETSKVAQESVPVGNLSTFVTGIYEKVFRLQRSLARQGLLTFVSRDPSLLDDDKSYVLKAAGDIDVIQRNENLQKRLSIWPLVSQTLLANVFMMDIIRAMFPDDASRYEQILAQQQNNQQAMMALVNLLNTAIRDDAGEIRPEFAEFAPQIEAIVGQSAGAGAGAGTQQMQG